ncbi:unnamed protein product [Linum trigynum]|uniref:Uncharacterized protein n=1 Tax=Linum trigynum TaxID=586398 RepID=A0AAV2DUX6_9ROSI
MARDGSSHPPLSADSGSSPGRKKSLTGVLSVVPVSGTTVPAPTPINLDSSDTITDPITAAAQGMLNLNILSPFSTSEIDWDFSGIDIDFGGSWSDDGRFLLGGAGDGSYELTDVALGLGIENVEPRGDASAMGDNLASFENVPIASVSSEEGLSIDEQNSPELPDSPSLELSKDTSGEDYRAVADDTYSIHLHEHMWGKREVPARAFERGPDRYSKLTPITILTHLRNHQLPTDWKYAAPSPTSRAGTCPKGWITIYTEQLKCGLRFPLDPIITQSLLCLNCTLGRLSPTVIFHACAYRLACQTTWG